MKLKKFRIQNYKCIIDSGWVDIRNFTVFVGPNQSGKSAHLEALCMLNPSLTIPTYFPEHSYTRTSRLEDDLKPKVSAIFKLSDEELEEVIKLGNISNPLNEVLVIRNNDGFLTIHAVTDDIDKDIDINSPDITPLSLETPLSKGFNDFNFDDSTIGLIDTVIRLGCDIRIQLFNTTLSKFNGQRAQFLRMNEGSAEADMYFTSIITTMNAYAKQIGDIKSLPQPFHNFIYDLLPRIIYMVDIPLYAGSGNLAKDGDETKQDPDERFQIKSKRQPILQPIASIANKDPSEIIKFKHRRRRRLEYGKISKVIQSLMDRGGFDIQHNVNLIADGDNIDFDLTSVNKDSPFYETNTNLSEMSFGTQNLISFLLLIHGQKYLGNNYFMLLDEPGLHLHPDWQGDLLEYLKTQSEKNQMIISTHSPFMVDLKDPLNIKVVEMTKEGSKTTDKLISEESNRNFVLQAALGMNASQSFLVSQKNLIVEGIEDFWILNALSNLLLKSGKPGLLSDIFITPACGTGNIFKLCLFMLGQKLNVVVLIDSDNAGIEAKEKLNNELEEKINSQLLSVISIESIIETDDDKPELESIFQEGYYNKYVYKVHEQEMKVAGYEFEQYEAELKGDDSIVAKNKRFFAMLGKELNKKEIIKQITVDIDSQTDISEYNGVSEHNAKSLIDEINKRL